MNHNDALVFNSIWLYEDAVYHSHGHIRVSVLHFIIEFASLESCSNTTPSATRIKIVRTCLKAGNPSSPPTHRQTPPPSPLPRPSFPHHYPDPEPTLPRPRPAPCPPTSVLLVHVSLTVSSIISMLLFAVVSVLVDHHIIAVVCCGLCGNYTSTGSYYLPTVR